MSERKRRKIDYYSTSEALAELGICRRTLSRWEDSGFISPYRRNSRSLFWLKEDVRKLAAF